MPFYHNLTLILWLISAPLWAQSYGCTDPLAENYNPAATQNDGSCIYSDAIINPVTSWELPETVYETSGLIIWENKLWTHNDNDDINLYAFDTTNVNNYEAYPLTGTINIDWEEISQDEHFVYIGDFGNNHNGNRTNLQILRIEKQSLLDQAPVIDTIRFSYELQTDFSPSGPNNTDFDCEAFIVTSDSIYLFTKQWVSEKTSLYSLPKQPGTYIAHHLADLDVEGLITGSTYLEEKRLVVLTGYSNLLQPFLFLLYDFQEYQFFSANKRKIQIGLPFHQVEAVTTVDGLSYFISNEQFTYSVITIPQKLHLLDLSEFLEDYLLAQPAGIAEDRSRALTVYPNPALDGFVYLIHTDLHGHSYRITDLSGKVVHTGIIRGNRSRLDLSGLENGMYLLSLPDLPGATGKIVVK